VPARPQTSVMRALILKEFEAPLILDEIAPPIPRPGQVLVEVAASGVNPLDLKLRAGGGAAQGRIRATLPAILGLDLAGVVIETSPGVTGFRPGDRVYGLTGGVGDLPGSLAEQVAVDARLIAPVPETLSLREAAALPLALITSWEALVDRARVHPGQRVLIHGGAGGLGHIAIQLARARGAEVFATGSPRSVPAIDRLGATPVGDDAEDFDIVFDTVGGPVLDRSFAAVKVYTGHVVSALGWATHDLAPLSLRGATYSGVFALRPLLTGEGREHHGEILRKANILIADGAIRPVLDPRRFGLSEVAEAHDIVAGRTSTGKVVIEIR
jgi:NADPH:quinone reductase